MDAASYVPGLYTVAERDAIFTKAKKYPDAANGLQNQVPTIFPDGTIGWRQIPEGGDGTANANIAVVEPTNTASKTYYPGDLLIYNGQLYVATVVISSGAYLYPDSNILPTRADMQFLSINGKGENCFRNWYFYGGGSQQGGGQLPINQRGLPSYTAVGETIDGWSQTGGTTTVEDYYIRHTSPANASSDLYQVVNRPFIPGATSISFGVLSGIRFFSGNFNFGALSEETVVYSGDDCQLLLAPVSDNRIKAIIRVYAGHNVILTAAKLEIGPISTLCLRSSQVSSTYRLVDTPPDYGEELAKCQRYLLVLRPSTGNALIAHGYGQNSTHYRFSIPSPVTMLPPTSISKTGRVQILTNGTYTDISDIALLWGSNGNSVNVEVTLSEPLSAFELYGYAMLVIIGGSSIIISAEP